VDDDALLKTVNESGLVEFLQEFELDSNAANQFASDGWGQ